MNNQLLTPEGRKTKPPRRPAPVPDYLGPALVAIGLAMGIVGFLDLALAWVPSRFGNSEWEFATTSRTFDSMALGTLGLALLGVGAAMRGSRLVVGIVTGLFAVMTVLVLAAAGLYLLNVPVAIGTAGERLGNLLYLAIARTSAFIVVYTALYLWLARFSWKQYRSLGGRS